MASLSKQRAAWISVASNTFLTAVKIVAGIFTGSVSILSEAAHSGMDLIAAGIATFSVHASDRPPDEDHPYGHEKIENISGVIEGVLIFGAAAWIIYESIDKLIHGVHLQHLGPGAAVMAVSAGLNTVVAAMLKRVAVRERSVALEADAAHLSTDVYTSLGVFFGLIAITVADRFFSADIKWLDPVAAIGVALLIIHVAYQITKKSFLPLMDVAGSPDEESSIREMMKEFSEDGVSFHKLRTRRAGGSLHVDLHMGFKPGVTLEDGHGMSHRLKASIEKNIPGAKVLIHVEPSERIEDLPDDDERVKCISDELVKDKRVTMVYGIRARMYGEEMRVEADLCVEPEVTLAESRSLTNDLRKRILSCFPAVKELVFSLHPGDGWQNAIHEDDKMKIKEVIGEHESSYAGIHYLQVSSSGGMHYVRLNLAVPPSLPVSVAHSISLHLEEDIKGIFPKGVEVDLHIEPCDKSCEVCKASCPEKSFV